MVLQKGQFLGVQRKDIIFSKKKKLFNGKRGQILKQPPKTY